MVRNQGDGVMVDEWKILFDILVIGYGIAGSRRW